MKEKKWMLSTRIAHRGLHDNKLIPENSLLAFDNAVKNGFGIEFDVYLTLDGKLIVHHDYSLERTCGLKVNAPNIDSFHLDKYKLFGTNECIPTLDDMLALVNGQVPLILEIKATKRIDPTCRAIYETIKNYKGNIAVESFDKRIVDWWIKNHNEFVIGQLYSNFPPEVMCLKMNRQYKKVDFLAVSTKHLPDKYFAKVKKKCPDLYIINWTVKTREHLKNALKYADNYIFETNRKDDSYISLDDII